MRVLLPPFGEVLLVTAVTSEEVRIAKVHLDIGALGGQKRPNVFRIGDIDFAQLGGDFRSSRVEVVDELLIQMHTRGTDGQRVPARDSRDHGEGIVFCRHGCWWQMQQNAAGVDQADGIALTHEGHGRAFDDGDPQLVWHQAHDGCVLHPGKLLEGGAALV